MHHVCIILCMQAFGSFPCEMSVLDLESDLEWNPEVSTINSSPLAIYDDGAILYFKYVCKRYSVIPHPQL